ncbi:hypothetical protein A3D78_07700 [Candidatus Gottesmanbacteria bacterium RIFCSPHIGHO2_02_FULL_39_14]|uniref:Uncharacterized protein n=1 Tax=Candidatus Gottesmanbacteria bacterium RIFCSPHIGHO2_02_FULL_39_14 TaxID=1798383 RepID=A0A1F5ZX92_9BACT|nr:MAG: hypothetical protein A3D78_07700 [Candidatus Gottesmanbacteria bacterium RIFCSPHIGHO2_02_FULL_39_14]
MNNAIENLRYTPLNIPSGSLLDMESRSGYDFNAFLFERIEQVRRDLQSYGTLFQTDKNGYFFKAIFGQNGKITDAFYLWENIAYKVLLARNNSDVLIGDDRKSFLDPFPVQINAAAFTRILSEELSNISRENGDEKVRTALSAINRRTWPIRERLGNYIFGHELGSDSNIFFFLAAGHIIRESDYEAEKILTHLRTNNLFNKESFEQCPPLYAFLSQIILIYGEDTEFEKFVLGLHDNMMESSWDDWKVGLRLLRGIFDRFEYIFGDKDRENGRVKLDLDISKKSLVLNVNKALRERFMFKVYSERSQVIAVETIRDAEADPDNFWEIIFDREIANTLKRLFTGKGMEKLKDNYEAAMAENKQKPDLFLMLAHSFGLPKKIAQILAATNHMAFGGALKPIDQIIDREHQRKGKQSMLAKNGLSRTLNSSLRTIVKVLKSTLDDQDLSEKFLDMLDISAEADEDSRNLTWESTPEEHFRVMYGINTAFSWFVEYFGNKTGLKDAGNYLSKYHANYLGLLYEIVCDIEDVMPQKITAESGKDYGTKITLPLTIMVNLTENELPDKLKPQLKDDIEFIKNFFEQEKNRKSKSLEQITGDAKNDLIKALNIGQKYRKYIVAKLLALPQLQKIYLQSHYFLKLGFDSFPVKDELNKRYYEIFKRVLDETWNKLQSFAEVNGDVKEEKPE